jgi:hypothetical protein
MGKPANVGGLFGFRKIRELWSKAKKIVELPNLSFSKTAMFPCKACTHARLCRFFGGRTANRLVAVFVGD